MLLLPASYGHGPFAFNAHLDAAGAAVKSAVHTTVTIDERSINTAYRDVRDPYHLAQGGVLGRIHKNFTTLQLAGRIMAPDRTQPGSLSDREREMLAAFDPYLCLRDSPSTDGAYPFDFVEMQASGVLLPLRYYARPLDRPRIKESVADNGVRMYALGLVAPDPRVYEQTEQTLVLTSGTPSGNIVNNGTVPGPLKATIVMSGAGAANFRITRAGVIFQMNLAGLAAGTVVVLFETCGPYGAGKSITRSGVSIFSVKTSDASTWLDAPVGTTAASITNLTGITSVTLAWYSARA